MAEAGQASEQILLEVVRIKLSSCVNVSKADRRLLIGYVEAQYAPKRKYRTKESKVYGGTVFGIPFAESLSCLTLLVFIMDKNPDLTVDIGRSVINLPDGLDLRSLDSTPRDCTASMTPFKGKERVGTVLYRISKISIFAEGNPKNNFDNSRTVPETGDLNVLCPLPDFRFNRLAKPIHWERLKGLNLDRIIHGVDLTTLMTVVDDVAVGDVSQEDVDHKLLKTLQISQYSVQYLLSCQKAMRKNKSTINETLRVFDDEEAMLDLRLARMRTRSKALKRESASLDTLHSEYSELLLAIDPILMKAYKKSLHADSTSSKKRFLNDFTSGIDGIARTDRKLRSEDRTRTSTKTVAISVDSDIYGNDDDATRRKSSDTWVTQKSKEQDETNPSYIRESKNNWAGHGTWESGSTILTKRSLKKRSDSDSDSDSKEDPKSSSSRSAVSGSIMAKEMNADSVLGERRLSLSMQGKDVEKDWGRDRDRDRDQVSVTLDKPRVTFDSSSNFSKSELNYKPSQRSNDSDDEEEEEYRDSLNALPKKSSEGWADIDQNNGKNRNKNNRKQGISDDNDGDGEGSNVIQSDVRHSAAWSTMETQLSAMSADSLSFTSQKIPTSDQNIATVLMDQNIIKKKVLQIPEISESPDTRARLAPYNDDLEDIDDVEVINLDGPPIDKLKLKLKQLDTPVLKSLRIDPDDVSVHHSVVSLPEFAPVAAVISSKWSENDIGDVILKNRTYDSDSSRNSPSPSSQGHRTPQSNVTHPYRDSSPQSDSDLDTSPVREKKQPLLTTDARADKVADSWAAGKDVNKFNAFLNSTGGGIAMATNYKTENQTNKDGRTRQNSHELEKEFGDFADTKKSAYSDFISKSNKGMVSDKLKEEDAVPLTNRSRVDLESHPSEIPYKSSSSRTISMDALQEVEDSKADPGSSRGQGQNEEGKEEETRRMSQMQEHEDLFERPVRSSLSSTFPTPLGQGSKQHSESNRQSRSNSITLDSDDENFFNDDDDDGGDEGEDIIDTSTSVTLDFFPTHDFAPPIGEMKGEAHIANKRKENTVAFKSAEDLILSQASVSNAGGNDWNEEVRGPSDALGGTERLEARRAGPVKDLHFTMRDSEERSSARADHRSSSRPDSTEEQDDDVLYGTIRFGGTRAGHDDVDKILKGSLKGTDSKHNFNASTPFGTLSPANWQRQSREVKVDRSDSNSSNESNYGAARHLDEHLDSSFQPSESANSLNFNLSQSTVLCDIEKLNSMIDSKQKKRGNSGGHEDDRDEEDEEEDSGDIKHRKADVKSLSMDEGLSGLKWRAGRASTELIETGRAFDVFVSALKLHDESFLSVRLQLEFLGLRSALSPMIPHTAITTVQPVNFSSHIRSAPEIVTLLTDEIQAEGEYLSFRINLRDVRENEAYAEQEQCDEETENILAQGSVALWVMIEDSCSILRQEVDILDCVSEEVIGFAVVDVRGHRLLKECS